MIAAERDPVEDSIERVGACYLCGGTGRTLYSEMPDQLFAAPGLWRFMACQRCGLLWLDPRPTAAELARLYSSFYHYTHSATWGEVGRVARTLRKLGRPARDAAASAVLRLRARPPGRLLDIGCGSGQFLASMRDLGWQVRGVEPDPEAARVAREHFGLDVHEGLLDEFTLSESSFDVVTLSHVVEHVPDPVGLLARCYRLLASDGRLVIVTPNSDSLGRRLLGKAWFLGWSPPWHLHVFSPETLRECARRAGFNHVEVRSTARRARLAWLTDRLLPSCGTLPAVTPQRVSWRLRLEALTFWALESACRRRWAVGEELVVVATP